MERVLGLASQSAVVIFSMSTCCMCHAVKKFFSELGVNATVHELDEEEPVMRREMEQALAKLIPTSRSRRPAVVPAVFTGGKLVGATDRVMALHLAGELVPMLRDAGALWL